MLDLRSQVAQFSWPSLQVATTWGSLSRGFGSKRKDDHQKYRSQLWCTSRLIRTDWWVSLPKSNNPTTGRITLHRIRISIQTPQSNVVFLAFQHFLLLGRRGQRRRAALDFGGGGDGAGAIFAYGANGKE